MITFFIKPNKAIGNTLAQKLSGILLELDKTPYLLHKDGKNALKFVNAFFQSPEEKVKEEASKVLKLLYHAYTPHKERWLDYIGKLKDTEAFEFSIELLEFSYKEEKILHKIYPLYVTETEKKYLFFGRGKEVPMVVDYRLFQALERAKSLNYNIDNILALSISSEDKNIYDVFLKDFILSLQLNLFEVFSRYFYLVRSFSEEGGVYKETPVFEKEYLNNYLANDYERNLAKKRIAFAKKYRR